MNENLFTIKGLINTYLESLIKNKKTSMLTIKNYKFYLDRFVKFLGQKEPPIFNLNQISKEVINEFLLFLSQSNDFKLKQSTISYHIIALRSFLKYLNREGFNTVNPELIDVPKGDEREVILMTHEQVEILLKTAAKDTRDRCIMELLLSTGLRVSDLVKLNRSGVNLSRNEIIIDIVSHKRIVFLTTSAVYWLTKYLHERIDDSDALFIRRRGSSKGNLRLTSRSVERTIEKYVKKTNLSVNATPQTFRNAFALDLLNSDKVKTVNTAIHGRNSITSLNIYDKNSFKEIHRELAGFVG